MGFLDKFINNFFDGMKKRHSERTIKDLKKKDPDLAKKMDAIHNEYKELNDYLQKAFGDDEE